MSACIPARMRRGAASLKKSNETERQSLSAHQAPKAQRVEYMVAMICNGLMLLAFIAGAAGSSVFEPTRRFDVFGDIKCEDEMARLDNFAIQLQNDPQSKGAIMVYAGKMAGDKWPRRGETEARAARIKSYLVKKRGTPTDQVI